MKKVLVLFLFTALSLLSIPALGAVYTSGATTITVSGSTVTVSGSGAMADYDYEFNPSWVSNSITRITIEEGVTHIGAYAFIEAMYVTRVDIPTSVTSIGESAFASCTKVAGIYYAGSTNEWASITFANNAANPFGDSNATNRNFYFYGSETATTTLVLTPGITEVKAYAFYNANKLANINIPGSVATIGAYAFRCSVSSTVCVNRATPPATGTNAITYGGSAKLYVPTGAKAAYDAIGKPWKWSAGTYGVSSGATNQAVSGSLAEASTITWNLDEDGVLTINATSSTKSIAFNLGGSSYPWGNFRRLVYKVKITGDITGIGNLLAYHWGLSEVIVDQQTIPTCSEKVATSSYSSGTPYNSLFNPRDPLTLRIHLSSLLSSTERAKLESAPWSNAKWQIALSDKVIVSENTDNDELLGAIDDYIDVPFTMQLTRSLSDAYYNTFCSPIDMSAAQVNATFGSGTKIHALNSTTYDSGENLLTLNFSDSQDFIEAGVPYIILPKNNVSNPEFADVDPSSVATIGANVNTTDVIFYGNLSPVAVTSDQVNAQSFIFLQAENHLTWANGGTLKGMRAYWLLKPGVPAHVLARRPVMRIGNSATAIEEVQSDNVQSATSGQYKCTKVLRDGQLYLMHEGTMYDVQGKEIK